MKHLQRNLFIGLGGIGVKTIVETKAQFLNHCSQNEALPSGVEFLGVDTDMTALGYSVSSKCGEVRLSPRELFCASVFNAREYFYAHKSDMTWMPKQNLDRLVGHMDRGAGTVRSNGRFAFMYHHKNLFHHICMSLDSLMSPSLVLPDDIVYCETGKVDYINVHVVFSLCGGTGSGMFLDVAYLIREIARESNLNIHLKGYGVLPGVFMSEMPYPNIWFQSNTYAALRELDYLSSSNFLAETGIKMPWMDNSTSDAPFDSMILVDNVNANGLRLRPNDMMQMLSMALMASVTELGSFIEAKMFKMLFRKIDGKYPWVSSMGISAITYDGRDVARVYELKTQNKLIQELLAVGDCNTVANYWIDMVRIRENNGKDQVIDYLYDLQGITAPTLTRNDFDRHTVVEKINNKMRLYSQYYQLSTEEWNAKVDALYETTKMAMIEKEEELCKSSLGNVISFLQEVKRQIVECFQKEMSEELLVHNQERNDAKVEYDATVAQLASYLKSGLFHPKIDTYITAIKGHYHTCLLADLESKRRSAAIEFYAKMVGLIESELTKFNSAKEKFESIKDDNEVLISRLQNKVGSYDTVLINLADDFIKEVELKEDENIPVSGLIVKLPGQSLYHEATKETYQIVLNEYTQNLVACNSLRNQTIDDILNKMDQEEFEHLIRRAANFSRPFLKLDRGKQEQFDICVPDVRTSRLTVNDYYCDIIDAEVANPMSIGLTDCVIIYCQSGPVPVFAIDGIDQMENVCARMQPLVSSYIDENLRKRMDEEHFSLIPSMNLMSEENDFCD